MKLMSHMMIVGSLPLIVLEHAARHTNDLSQTSKSCTSVGTRFGGVRYMWRTWERSYPYLFALMALLAYRFD